VSEKAYLSADSILRGRDNKVILNASVGLAALQTGIPSAAVAEWEIPYMLTNNTWLAGAGSVKMLRHPLFDFSSDRFTLFGLDFNDLYNQLFHGDAPEHYQQMYAPLPDVECALGDPMCREAVASPYLRDGESLAEMIGLPDLPYGELTHLAHFGLAMYDSFRTAYDIGRDDEVNWNPVKILTHPDMLHTLCARGVMLTVMGLAHPFGGALVGIGLSYLAAHLVHSVFGWLHEHKDFVQRMENTTILSSIYENTGLKAWVEQDKAQEMPVEQIDPFAEPELEQATPRPQEDLRPSPRVHYAVLHDLLNGQSRDAGRQLA
jgi:hypothetical protein